MARRKLKHKVELSIFWLGLFCLTYLIFGFILKSDLTKPVDSSIFYEVLKDGLTIAAAFLAPIAAFILFSDWREEHRIKTLLNLMEQLKLNAGKIEDALINFEKTVKNIKVMKDQEFQLLNDSQIIGELLLNLSRRYIELNSDIVELTKYRQLIDSFGSVSRNLNTKLRFMEFLVYSVRKYEVLRITEDRNYIDYKQQMNSMYQEINPLLKNISEIYDSIVEEGIKIENSIV